MDTKIAETSTFINQIDGRLNNLVANINENPGKDLDKLEVIDDDMTLPLHQLIDGPH